MACKSCKDCFNNCDKPTSDKCVKYTGPEIEFLGICTGDPLSELEAAIIEKLKDLIIVDFPGFDDTNGILISLGIELGIKNLILKYSPKILILESITNNANRYEAASKLGSRLSRLLENKID